VHLRGFIYVESILNDLLTDIFLNEMFKRGPVGGCTGVTPAFTWLQQLSALSPDAVVGVLVTVDVTHEPLPVQPAHGGFQREAIVQRLSSAAH